MRLTQCQEQILKDFKIRFLASDIQRIKKILVLIVSNKMKND